MSIFEADERCTRRTPQGTPTSTSTSDHAHGFSKAGRRVLAELVCNDSPVVGLLPAGTPTSMCKQTSSSGTTVLKSRRELLLANMPPSLTVSTPLGESLLRSQVHLLLQRVESDTRALPCRPASKLSASGDDLMLLSPIMVAPTPLNTPATTGLSTQAPPAMDVMDLQNASTNGVPSLCVEEPHHQDVLSASSAMSENKQQHHAQLGLLLSEESDMPSSTEIFPGKRVLHFGDDTPCKAAIAMNSEEPGCSSLLRQIDDDEVSEWSVNVNVGSPADKQCIMEQGEGPVMVELGVSPVNDEHMKKVHQASMKVDLLWDRARKRRLSPSRRDGDERLADQEEEGPADTKLYYSDSEGMEGGEQPEDCESLCDMFEEMRVEEEEEEEEEREGLPRGEGKHIRFLYGEGEEEEFVEAVVVKGEEDMLRGCGAVRLHGMPAPMGRHWRFPEEDDDDDDDGDEAALEEEREASNHG